MRLLRFVNTIDPATGGPIGGIRALSPVLAAQGHVTDIITFDSAPLASRETIAGVRTIIYAGPAKEGHPPAVDLAAWLKTHAGDYDAAIAHGLWQAQTRTAWRHLRGRLPYYVFPHGMLDPWFRRAYPLKHVKKWLYWLALERHVFHDAAAVLFTCEEERRLGRTTFRPYACTEKVVNYGAAAPPPATPAQREAFARSVPLLGAAPYLLFLGRIHPKKGVDLLITAYMQLAQAHDSAAPLPALVIAGPEEDAAYASQLRAQSTGLPSGAHVHWAGMLQGDAKWGALNGAEAFILPSHQENFGIAVAEALACGTTVLISDKVNIWREIEADHAGLVAPDTLAGTTALLQNWLSLPVNDRAAMRAAASACFQKRFTMQAVADSLVTTVSSAS